MDTIVAQTNQSQRTDEAQVPKSAQKKPTKTGTKWSKASGVEGTSTLPRGATITNHRAGFMEPDTKLVLDLEEYFEGFVEEITDSAIQLRTTSSTGEEGVAWLPIERIPEDERKYVALGVPVRISIIMRRGGTNEREHHIRFLRPSQWRVKAGAEVAVDYLLDKMKAVLR